MLTANCSNRRFKLDNMACLFLFYFFWEGLSLQANIFIFFAISGQGPPGQAWGAGIDVRSDRTGRPAPPPLFRRLALHRRWEIRFKSAKPTEWSFCRSKEFALV